MAPTRTGRVDVKRALFLAAGVLLFVGIYVAPPFPDAVDPAGQHFALTREGKGALAIFIWASVWWVSDVIPVGITSLLIGILQSLCAIRPADDAFRDFMTPSVMFIFSSIIIGMVFTKTGLTRRLAYRMLMLVGERTSRIILGCYLLSAAMAHIMAHTAVAATLYPLLVAINSMYGEGHRPTQFGKSLFMGMAYASGAGSIVTLLGSARGAVAIGFFKDITGQDISFFQLTYYMAPIGWLMTFLIWGFFMLFLPPEKVVIPGLRDQARKLNAELGPLRRQEVLAAVIIFTTIVVMSMRCFIPALAATDKTAIILVSTVLFFVFHLLDIEDLEHVPWNIILLFGGAMSIGFCMWETGAAQWLAIQWLVMFQDAHWFAFVFGMAFFVMLMTNFIMNVAAIAISLPVSLVIAPYLGVAPEVILFTSLVVAGMPFLLLVGAAPNAIAYNSKQFTTGQFFLYGLPASALLLAITALAVAVIWPLMGMPITLEW